MLMAIGANKSARGSTASSPGCNSFAKPINTKKRIRDIAPIIPIIKLYGILRFSHQTIVFINVLGSLGIEKNHKKKRFIILLLRANE